MAMFTPAGPFAPWSCIGEPWKSAIEPVVILMLSLLIMFSVVLAVAAIANGPPELFNDMLPPVAKAVTVLLVVVSGPILPFPANKTVDGAFIVPFEMLPPLMVTAEPVMELIDTTPLVPMGMNPPFVTAP
jgi:hypothetical protein